MAGSGKPPRGRTLLDQASAILGQHVRRGARVCAALSGGVDSVVLLDVLRRLAPKFRFRLAAVHVNHQLSSNADRWEAFCGALCRARRIPFTAARVDVARGDSVENAARLKRYGVFAAQPAEFVALAHHLDDQAETVLLQLLRGAGIKGLSAMPVLREARGERREERNRGNVQPSILRPLLDVPRSEILRYANARKLEWIEDESNLDAYYDRNFLRRCVLPLVTGRFPAYRTTIARASRHLAEAARLLDDLAAADADLDSDALQLAALQRLTDARAKNVLRRYLDLHGVAMPNSTRLEECLRQVREAKTGSRITADFGSHELRQRGGLLQLVRKREPAPLDYCRDWAGERNLPLPEVGGTLRAVRRRGTGVSRARLEAAPVTLRLRQGGERLQLDPKRPRRSLKNLLQEAKLPAWERERLPLIYCGGELVCVPGIGIDWRFAAKRQEAGIEFAWERNRAE
jgi:tRNA(Ile)-lysidine synthase